MFTKDSVMTISFNEIRTYNPEGSVERAPTTPTHPYFVLYMNKFIPGHKVLEVLACRQLKLS